MLYYETQISSLCIYVQVCQLKNTSKSFPGLTHLQKKYPRLLSPTVTINRVKMQHKKMDTKLSKDNTELCKINDGS